MLLPLGMTSEAPPLCSMNIRTINGIGLMWFTLIFNAGCHEKDERKQSKADADRQAVTVTDLHSPFDAFPATSVEWGNDGLLKGVSSHAAFDDIAAVKLSKYASLEYLTLIDSPISDTGVESLTGLQKLSVLSLSGTKITSNCMPSIAKMGTLSYLDLSGTRVDHSSLQPLLTLKSLKSLIVSNTLLTRADIAALRNGMPWCKIED